MEKMYLQKWEKIIWAFLVLAFIAAFTLGANDIINTPGELQDEVTIAASANTYTGIVRCDRYKVDGYQTLQVKVTDPGTAKAEIFVKSVEAGTWIEPTSTSDIATGITSVSGYNSGKYNAYPISPGMLTDQYKILFTETGGANSVTIKYKIVVQ